MEIDGRGNVGIIWRVALEWPSATAYAWKHSHHKSMAVCSSSSALWWTNQFSENGDRRHWLELWRFLWVTSPCCGIICSSITPPTVTSRTITLIKRLIHGVMFSRNKRPGSSRLSSYLPTKYFQVEPFPIPLCHNPRVFNLPLFVRGHEFVWPTF